jgi:hypothetical protein
MWSADRFQLIEHTNIHQVYEGLRREWMSYKKMISHDAQMKQLTNTFNPRPNFGWEWRPCVMSDRMCFPIWNNQDLWPVNHNTCNFGLASISRWSEFTKWVCTIITGHRCPTRDNIFCTFTRYNYLASCARWDHGSWLLTCLVRAKLPRYSQAK